MLCWVLFWQYYLIVPPAQKIILIHVDTESSTKHTHFSLAVLHGHGIRLFLSCTLDNHLICHTGDIAAVLKRVFNSTIDGKVENMNTPRQDA